MWFRCIKTCCNNLFGFEGTLSRVVKCNSVCSSRYITSTFTSKGPDRSPHVAIIGSGPAGFYTAQGLIKELPDAKIDIYEKLPVPFGLVRYGVAPDHPEVKNCINQFTTTGDHSRCSFYGNVNVGTDVSVDELKLSYHIIVFSYGAEDDNLLNIPGENLKNCLSARRFVGWYNGVPEDADLDVDLSHINTVAILGHGNVALDVARILLTPTSALQSSDISSHALHRLSESRVQRVYILGRRGPLQVSFTIKELREMTKLPGVSTRIDMADFDDIHAGIKDLERPRRRLTELMYSVSSDLSATSASGDKCWQLVFCRSPLSVDGDGDGRVTGVTVAHNELEYSSSGRCTAVPVRGRVSHIPCDLVVRSIGYRSLHVDPGLPYDTRHDHIVNNMGRVHAQPGVYCSGWCGHPPTGVILSTMTGAFHVARTVAGDVRGPGGDHLNPHLRPTAAPGSPCVLGLLRQRGKRVVTWDGWKRIDAEERVRGEAAGKPREKMVNVDEMLDVAGS